ncbi:MAG: tetratricopeptide repeat protein [Vicinamibacterales bacterium]
MMRKFSSRAVMTALVAVCSVTVVGCGQIRSLQARQAFKDANGLYQGSDYRGAAAKYEEAVELDPSLVEAYFYLGNSYDNLYRPTRAGEPENDALLDKAIAGYSRAADSNSPQRKLALQYLVAAYGPDRLNDPARAEPIVKSMIQLDPADPTNYFALAQIYENAGLYDEAEAALLQAREAKPNDPAVYMQLAGYYNRQGQFPKTIEALEQRVVQEPDNPEAHHTVATFYWDEVYRNFRLADADKRRYIESGIASVDKALALKSDYFEALTYKNLLLRLQANLERDPARQQALIRQADQLRDQAEELQKQQQAGGAAAAPSGN